MISGVSPYLSLAQGALVHETAFVSVIITILSFSITEKNLCGHETGADYRFSS
jgi:hypothetical protein